MGVRTRIRIRPALLARRKAAEQNLSLWQVFAPDRKPHRVHAIEQCEIGHAALVRVVAQAPRIAKESARGLLTVIVKSL
jgi:hypothetical protein